MSLTAKLGDIQMTQVFLTVLFVLAMSMLTFAASLAESPGNALTAPIALHE